MPLNESIDVEVKNREDWALRRRRGIPNNKKLFVLTCMDERIPVEKALRLGLGDAHIYRNAGAQVTDDVIRSAALTTNFFGTTEIVVVLHTECGMLLHSGEELAKGLEDKAAERGTPLHGEPIDPGLPDLELHPDSRGDWIKAFDDVDASAERQVELLRASPLIPGDVKIHAYIYEVESDKLRRPRARLGDTVSVSPVGSAT